MRIMARAGSVEAGGLKKEVAHLPEVFMGLTGEPVCARLQCTFLTSAIKHLMPRDHKSDILHLT